VGSALQVQTSIRSTTRVLGKAKSECVMGVGMCLYAQLVKL